MNRASEAAAKDFVMTAEAAELEQIKKWVAARERDLTPLAPARDPFLAARDLCKRTA